MRAALATRCAAAQAPESFTIHVASDGNDTTGTGTRAAPYLLISKALSVANAGDSIGLRRGDTFRPASQLSVADTNVRVGAYGSGAKPILSGGAVIGSWLEVPSGGATYVQRVISAGPAANTAHNLTPSANTTQDNRLILAIKTSGGVAVTSVTDSASNTWTLDRQSANTSGGRCCIASAHLSTALTTSSTVTVNVASSASLAVAAYEYSGVDSGSAPDTGAAASGSGTSAASGTTGTTAQANELAISVVASGSSLAGLTGPSGYTVRDSGQTANAVDLAEKVLTATGTESTTWTIPSVAWASCVETYKSATPTGTGVWTATVATRPTVVAWNGTLLAEDSSATVASNKWYYTGTTLYVNVGADPASGTLEVSSVDPILVNTAINNFRIRDVKFRFGRDRTLRFNRTNGHVVERCDFEYCGYSSNGGVVHINDGNDAGVSFSRVTRCTFDKISNDSVWIHNTKNVEVDRSTITNVSTVARITGGEAADGIQITESLDNGYGNNSDGFWFHHNSVDMTGSVSDKGCIIMACAGFSGASAYGTCEDNTLIGGSYGISPSISGVKVRNNVCTGQATAVAWGGAIQVGNNEGSLNDIEITGNTFASSSRHGIVVSSGGNTVVHDILIDDNDFTNFGYSGLNFQNPNGVSGTVTNNSFLWSVTPTYIVTITNAPPGAETLTLDYNEYDAEFTSCFNRQGSNYSTLAAWRTATGQEAHSSIV